MITIERCKELLKSGGKVYHNSNYSREMSSYDNTIEYIEVHYDRKTRKYIYKPVLRHGKQLTVCDLDRVFEPRTAPHVPA